MVIPEIMPGEILWGYWERFRAFNGFDRDSAIRALRYGIPPSNGAYKWPNLVTLLAGRLGMTTMDLCQHFTTLPFDRAVTDSHFGLRHGDPAMETLVRYKVQTFAWDGGMICPECVLEDEGYWGFGYFRREHQLRVIKHCSKHRIALMWQARGAEILIPSLSNGALMSKAVNHPNAENVSNDNLFMENRLGIIDHWLMQTTPIPVQVFKDVINRRKPRISHEVNCRLDALFFRLTNRAAYVPTHHALTLLATMFDSAEDALNAIQARKDAVVTSGTTLAPERFHESLTYA